ncbi:MAG: Lrp/AsnC family transcriptional regulator [Myxococcota bacterium]|nr:Lrp/AsnC family transcriptional regulator [Myxococcota bacterium]
MKLDATDLQILRELQEDAQLSNKELAARIGLSPSSCLERVRRLRRGDVIRGCHADVNPRALAIGLEAIIAVQLKHHSREQVEEFRDHVIALPEVTAAYHVAGAHDFLVHVAVHDSDHLRDLALDAFTTRPEVSNIQTSLIFESRRSNCLPSFVEVKEDGR